MSSQRENPWKRRAWQAIGAMHTAEMCRTVDDMRKTLRDARMQIEAVIVREQNERDIETRNNHSVDQEEEDELDRQIAADIEGT